MSISVVARKALWTRAGDTCAWRSCGERLTLDLHDPESQELVAVGVVLGEEAHIRSGSPNGPRHDPSYPAERVDTYENLILLCPTHHTRIDKNGGAEFPVDALIAMKRDHERDIASSRDATALRRQALDERLAAAVAVWEQRIDLDRWRNITGGLNYPIPHMTVSTADSLTACGQWLLARDWPTDYPKMASSFENLRGVIRHFLNHAHDSMEEEDGAFETIRAHKRIPWNPKRYAELLYEFQMNAAITWWYTLELTRAVNLVIQATRAELDPLYRFDQGVALMHEGDGIIDSRIVRAEYDPGDWRENAVCPSPKDLRGLLRSAMRANDAPTDVNIHTLAVAPSRTS